MRIQKYPELLHGLMSGAVILIAKVLLFLSGNWFFRVNPLFTMLTCLILLTGVILAGVGERKKRAVFSYWNAWMNGLKTLAIAIFISLLGDQAAYRTQPNLAAEMKDFQLEQMQNTLQQISFFSSTQKEAVLTEAEKAEPSQMYSVGAFLSSWITYLFLNALWLFIAAGYTRKKNRQTEFEDENA